MNLFRSEESVRAWADFDPKTEKAIKPVREWAGMLTGARVFRKRLEDDFVEKRNGSPGSTRRRLELTAPP